MQRRRWFHRSTIPRDASSGFRLQLLEGIEELVVGRADFIVWSMMTTGGPPRAQPEGWTPTPWRHSGRMDGVNGVNGALRKVHQLPKCARAVRENTAFFEFVERDPRFSKTVRKIPRPSGPNEEDDVAPTR
jgi:hypothetical protein